jgi:fructose/tagatose bisphosphate aldolase
VGRLGRAVDENLQIAEELLRWPPAAHIILEIEVGVVGGEEDGVSGRDRRQAVLDRSRTAWPPPPRSAWARRAAT